MHGSVRDCTRQEKTAIHRANRGERCVTRTIPVTYGGNYTDQVALSDLTTPVPLPAPNYEGVNVSHRFETPDHSDAAGYAQGAAVGGVLLACAMDVICVGGGVSTGAWPIFGAAALAAWLAVPAMYLGVYFGRLADRRAMDTRLREALPAPRPHVVVEGRAVLPARALPPERDAAKEEHAHKLMACAMRAASVIRNEAGEVVKEYGAAPLVRRDGRGKTKERAITFNADGVEYVIYQEEQEQLQAELAKVGLFTKRSSGWCLTDPTWTREDVLNRMEAAFSHAER